MSVRISALVWDADFPTQSQKLVALKLADHASDDGGNIYPAVASIAARTGCGRSTVIDVLNVFKDCGLLIEVAKRTNAPTIYRFHTGALKAISMGLLKLVGSAKGIVIEETTEDATQDPESETLLADAVPSPQGGPVSGPLARLGVQLVDGRVQWLDRGGPTAGPKPSLNHQEPSKSETSKIDLNKEEKPRPARPAIVIRRSDQSQWAAWLSFLPADKAAAAEFWGEVVADSRWPEKATFWNVKAKPRDITGEAA